MPVSVTMSRLCRLFSVAVACACAGAVVNAGVFSACAQLMLRLKCDSEAVLGVAVKMYLAEKHALTPSFDKVFHLLKFVKD